MKRPLIGVTAVFDYHKGRHWLGDDYCSAVSHCGGIPVIIPSSLLKEEINDLVAKLDGLLLSGGDDVNPLEFGQQPVAKMGLVDPLRDKLELNLTEQFIKTQKPILGVCRGMQVLNIVFGGTIIQDIYSTGDQWIGHEQKGPRSFLSHSVSINENSLLMKVMGKKNIDVNSFHHQAVDDLGSNLVANCTSNDGLIEGLEHTNQNILAVQWHPENLWKNTSENILLFDWLVKNS